jgi:hydrogenase expression/formation protein
MDLEGYAKRVLAKGEDPFQKLMEKVLEIKEMPRGKAEEFVRAIMDEVDATMRIDDELLRIHESGIGMGEFGVGSRGEGDFFVHERMAGLIGRTSAIIDSTHFDDAGVVRMDKKYIVITVDGIHSRLNDFPFLAGFHVTRAALRDIYVMAASPVALFSDIHVADDGDVAKIFDHLAGICAVSETMGVPLITGSTLRIGGDMVIGKRMTGCVGAVGIADSVTPREKAEVGDVILLTEGSGGGTISTAAIYHGEPDVVRETLNLKFFVACEALLRDGITGRIHTMTDVTNGGVRGDAFEIAKVAGVKLVFYEDRMRNLVNRNVLEMLNRHGIDYLGVSLDSLLIIAPEDVVDAIKKTIRDKGVAIDEIGYVEEGEGAEIVSNGLRVPLEVKFRESAYTPVKRVVGECSPGSLDEMKKKIDEAARKAMEKKMKVMEILNTEY